MAEGNFIPEREDSREFFPCQKTVNRKSPGNSLEEGGPIIGGRGEKLNLPQGFLAKKSGRYPRCLRVGSLRSLA